MYEAPRALQGAEAVATAPDTAPDGVQEKQAGRRPFRRLGTARVDWAFGGAVGLVAVWALFQNLFRIGTSTIVADEPTYANAAWRYVHDDVAPPAVHPSMSIVTPDNFEHPPLAKFLFGIAQLIAGSPDSVTADRVVSALCTLLAGLLIGVWIGRYAGRWTGLLAAALVTVLPETASGSVIRFDRTGMLDPVASFFMVLSVVLAWEWARRSGRSAWLWAAAAGVATGCAAGSKENGFLGVVGPIMLVVLMAAFAKKRFVERTLQAVMACALSVVVFVGLYLPFGHPLARIRYLIDFQSTQSAAGHLIGFAGQVSSKPPWWANLWFAGHSFGSALTVVLVIAALLAVVLRRKDLLTWWCVAALAVPVIFHCFIANVALGYYWVMWTPMFFVLAALGIKTVVEQAATVRRFGTAVAVVAAGVALAVPLGQMVEGSVTVATLEPTGIKALPAIMRQHGLHGTVIAAGLPTWLLAYYMPTTPVVLSAAAPVTGAETIVIGQPQCRELIDQSVRALVAVNLPSGRVREIYSDSAIVVYDATGPLTTPTTAQIAAEPPGNLTDHC